MIKAIFGGLGELRWCPHATHLIAQLIRARDCRSNGWTGVGLLFDVDAREIGVTLADRGLN